MMAWAARKCNSVWSELLIVAIALVPFLFARGVQWTEKLAGSWCVVPSGERLSLAGFWAVVVSGFFARALMYRWAWRLIIWARLLHRLARLDLNTVATHPDRAGGLGFMGEVEVKLGILAFATGSATSANVASNILFQNSTLSSEKLVIIAFIVGATLVFLLPLLALSGTLARTRRKGLREYGALASGYVQQFDKKWVQREGQEGETLLGTGDIQSLADLGNSFNMIREMSLLPIARRHIIALALSAAVPMLPLVFLDPWAMAIAQGLLARLL